MQSKQWIWPMEREISGNENIRRKKAWNCFHQCNRVDRYKSKYDEIIKGRIHMHYTSNTTPVAVIIITIYAMKF